MNNSDEGEVGATSNLAQGRIIGERSRKFLGHRGRIRDIPIARMLHLPVGGVNYIVRRNLSVAMRDGEMLLLDHYAPTTSHPKGTVLVRSIYGRASIYGLTYGSLFAQHGFHVVIQSTRGTFGSGGILQPGLGEADDGADTVAWLRKQDWFTGSFATVGMSFLGIMEWALMTDPPSELVAAVVASGPHSPGQAQWGIGAFPFESTLAWSRTLVHQEEHGAFQNLIRGQLAYRQSTQVLNSIPHGKAAETFLDGKAPWYAEWIAHNRVEDAYWQARDFSVALDRVEIPVLLCSGWQDLYLDQTLEQYEKLKERGVDVALTVGPWTHLQGLTRGLGLISQESIDWLDEHLAGASSRQRSQSVRIYVSGAEEWREIPNWPVLSDDKTLYLGPDGVLTNSPPDRNAVASHFTYDPTDPTPTVGGPTVAPSAGRKDNSKREARGDVLIFTGKPLETAIEVIGRPSLILFHRSENPYADVLVRLCEVDEKGHSWNVCDAYIRLEPGRTTHPLVLQLSATAHRFQIGSRIRLQVSGGSYPQYDRNFGTGESIATATIMRPSRRTISHGISGISQFTLPVAIQNQDQLK